MFIECLLPRAGGTKVEIGASVYRFVLDSNGRYSCEVTNATHIAILLAIVEGYRETTAPSGGGSGATTFAALTDKLALAQLPDGGSVLTYFAGDKTHKVFPTAFNAYQTPFNVRNPQYNGAPSTVYAAATNLLVTAVGGTFGATGTITVRAVFKLYAQSNYAY